MTILKSNPDSFIDDIDNQPQKPKTKPLLIFMQEPDVVNDYHESFHQYFRNIDDPPVNEDDDRIRVKYSIDIDEIITLMRTGEYTIVTIQPNELLLKDWFKEKCPVMAENPENIAEYKDIISDGYIYTATGSLQIESLDQLKSEIFVKACRNIFSIQ